MIFAPVLSQWRLIKDSRGVKSWTYTLSVPAIVLITLRWLVGGLTLTWAGHGVTISPVSGGDYAMMVGVWLGFIAQREYVEKKTANEQPAQGGNDGKLPQ